ncbi:MAG: ATP-binding protein [Desulfomonilaceae bacterium]
MNLKPWREVITPHEDILHGNFREAEFAADLSKVASGVASPEYQDPKQFFERTFITEGMRLLLISVLQRLSGKSGDPVIQLKTAFGGGKTHALLAVYHIARGLVPSHDLRGVPSILDAAGVSELPRANVAVLDGHDIAPAAPRKRDGITINTMWGELAWMLGGVEGYRMIATSDTSGASPGKHALGALFEHFAPCVILMDETVAYIRQFEENKSYPGGTFESNISFLQALTEVANSKVPVSILASLPESAIELGGARGKFALESIEKVFGRLEAIWKPVATEESFEIVRRRLFSAVMDEQARDQVCGEFFSLYGAHAGEFPPETREHTYLERLKDAYPIHPEIFDRLYNDWTTLENFQRTRGVLRLMALVINRLWVDNNQDALITPGSIPLYDPQVAGELTRYLRTGWEPIIESEVDGQKSSPSRIDLENPRLGAVQACRRVARTIFLGSAPSVTAQTVRGISEQNIRLGCVQAGQSPGVFDDALKRLSDRLHNLYSGKSRYWYDTRPNLRREMEQRSLHIDPLKVISEIEKRLKLTLKGTDFTGVHIFANNADIPDDNELRLVAIEPTYTYKRNDTKSLAIGMATEYLGNRGNQPRQYQNRLIFIACDEGMKFTLYEECRRYLAWTSILDDKEILNLDQSQIKDASNNQFGTDKKLNAIVRETYKWLLAPLQEPKPRGGLNDLEWEERQIPSLSLTLGETILKTLKENEQLVVQWAPTHLLRTLDLFYWSDPEIVDVPLKRLWEDFGRYNYLCRLLDPKVLLDCVARGIEEGAYGYSTGKDGEKNYSGLIIGRSCHCSDISLGQDALIVKADVAREILERINTPVPKTGGDLTEDERVDTGKVTIDKSVPGTSAKPVLMKRFYATIDLEPENIAIQASNIGNEIIGLLKKKYHSDVKVTLEIAAYDREGFADDVQRAVRENCNTLKFTSAEFEVE